MGPRSPRGSHPCGGRTGELEPFQRGEVAASLYPAMPQCPPSPSSSSPAVTKGLFILWAVPGQGGRPLQPPTLQQIQALVRHMAEDAQELFTFYVSLLPWGEGSLLSPPQGDTGLVGGVPVLLLSHIPDFSPSPGRRRTRAWPSTTSAAPTTHPSGCGDRWQGPRGCGGCGRPWSAWPRHCRTSPGTSTTSTPPAPKFFAAWPAPT